MVFSEATFLLLLLPITLLIYYSPLCKSIRVKNIWLLFVSIGFYAWGEPIYVLLMLLSICMNWWFGRLASAHAKTKTGKKIVAVACVYNLGVLFVFKYLGWLLGPRSAFASLTLPIGISFYTFQALSYVIDVYRGTEQAQKSMLDVGLYIAFFPQLIAGPIVRYGTISKQLKERTHSLASFSAGACRFVIGLSKKLLLADQLASLTDAAFAKNGAELSVALAWAGALSYMLQLYFDFSGYSDMAIGLGKMFGFTFPENFNYPYLSRSVSEYWRRWHISLGEWFRDYLFYPLSLGLTRRMRKQMNRKNARFLSGTFTLFVVWMATGIWHGANWTFVMFGFINFAFIFLEQHHKPIKNQTLGAVLGFTEAFLVVYFADILFRSASIGSALLYYSSMFHLRGNALLDSYGSYWLRQYYLILPIAFVFAYPVVETLIGRVKSERGQRALGIARPVVLCLLLLVDICYAVSGSYNPFLYFNF